MIKKEGVKEMMDNITISNQQLIVQINPHGAELMSIRDNFGDSAEQVEYLWQGDSKYWGDRAPVLFPYIARLTNGRYRLNGNEYEMDIHGFAKDSMFEVVELQQSSVTLALKSSEETYRQYPYRFQFEIIYHLGGKRLDVIFCVTNLDEKEMFFGIGGHPGFNVPLERGLSFDDYVLEFSKECHPKKIRFSKDCFVEGTLEEFVLKQEKVLPLRHHLFDEDAIVLTDIDRQIMLKSEKGKQSVSVIFPDMDFLGIWHKPNTDAPYVCIEPWSSLPSRKGIVEELTEQPGLIRLKAGEVYRNTWSIEIQTR